MLVSIVCLSVFKVSTEHNPLSYPLLTLAIICGRSKVLPDSLNLGVDYVFSRM